MVDTHAKICYHLCSHGEVIMTPTGPCLVEVGARPHGLEGTFILLADRCWGYNQVTALVDAVLPQPDLFNAIPDVCPQEKEIGFKVDLVSYVKGKLKAYDGLEKLRALPSFISFEALPSIGDEINITVDVFTACGGIFLATPDEKQLEADLAVIRECQKTLFVVE